MDRREPSREHSLRANRLLFGGLQWLRPVESLGTKLGGKGGRGELSEEGGKRAEAGRVSEGRSNPHQVLR